MKFLKMHDHILRIKDQGFSFLHWANWVKYELGVVKKPPVVLKDEPESASEPHGQAHYVSGAGGRYSAVPSPGAGSVDVQRVVRDNTI